LVGLVLMPSFLVVVGENQSRGFIHSRPVEGAEEGFF